MFLVDYSDGLRAAALMLGDNGYVEQFAYAGRRGGCIDAFAYQPDPGPNKAHFSYFGLNVEDFLLSGTPPSPVEPHAADHRRSGSRDDLAPSRRRTRHHTASGRRLRAGVRTPSAGPSGPHPSAAAAIPVSLPEPGATPAAEPIPIDRDGTVRRSSAAGSGS